MKKFLIFFNFIIAFLFILIVNIYSTTCSFDIVCPVCSTTNLYMKVDSKKAEYICENGHKFLVNVHLKILTNNTINENTYTNTTYKKISIISK